jgi:hypothetical protein
MSIEEVRKYITKRLSEGQEWAAMGFPGQILGINLRKYPCIIKPLRYINDSNKEGKGIRFRITWKGESGSKSYSDLDIYIVPEGFLGERSKYPYATIYAVNPESRSYRLQQDNCKVIQFTEYALKDSDLGPAVPVHEFFANLLKKSCIHERCASVLFRYQKPASKSI